MKIGDLFECEEGLIGLVLNVDESDNSVFVLWFDGMTGWEWVNIINPKVLS
jgi:uncharacterized protein YkvS